MKKILLCLDKNQFCPFNYKQKWKKAIKSMGYNSGNNVFQFALQKMLTDENYILDIDTNFLNNTQKFLKNIDFINHNYDYCVTSPANIIGVWAKETNLPRWTNAISKVKIPFIFVGVGAQSDCEYSFDFINDIRKESYAFIKAILSTGGQVGVRGFFTGEILKKLGFQESIDFEVIGCPSLFMNGKDLHININKKLIEEELVPLFNGFPCLLVPSFHKYFFKYLRSNSSF